MSKVYRVVHKQIDGLLLDREHGWPELELEIHPIGTELDKRDQGRELRLKIGKAQTILSEDGLSELIEFLKEIP